MKSLINRLRAWWYLDSVIDSARATHEDYQRLLDRYARLANAARTVVASRDKPVGWPTLQADIARLSLTLNTDTH